MSLSDAILAGQGDVALDAIIAEARDATRENVDDEGLALPRASHIVTALR